MPHGVVCGRCQYELAGLALAGVCPECGAEIRASYTGDLSIYRHRAYLEALSSAVQSIAWSTSSCIGALATFIALGVLGLMAGAAQSRVLMTVIMIVLACAITALPVWTLWLWVRGWWQLSTLADPTLTVHTDPMRGTRALLRIALVAQVVTIGVCLSFGLGVTVANVSAGWAPNAAVVRGATVVGSVLLVLTTGLCVLSGMALVRDRFVRFERPDEAKFSRRAGQFFAMAMCVLTLAGIVPIGVRPDTAACIVFVAIVWVIAAFVGISNSVQALHALTLAARERAVGGESAAPSAPDGPDPLI